MITRKNQQGVSLIELMITLVIGTVLLVGAMRVYQQSRSSYRVNEAISRLQENARFAIDTLEPDLRLSSNWGQTNRAEFVRARTGDTTTVPIPAFAGDCAPGFSTDLNNTLNGINGTSVVAGVDGTNLPMNGCLNTGFQAGSDVLVIRHASANPVVPDPGGLHIQTNRVDALLFAGTGIPAGFGLTAQTFRLISHSYYVNPNSPALGPGVPSLRRVRLIPGPALVDEEIIPGVEDFQIQFGIDTTGDLAANRYVNTDNPIVTPGNPAFIPTLQVISVRIWLRMRAERQELGFTDNANYTYADQNFAAPNDGFRRLLITKTIQLNNTRVRDLT